MVNYQTDLNGQYIRSNYYVEEVQDSRGFFRYCRVFIENSEFILDKKGIVFFKEIFDNGHIFVDENYLVRLNDSKIEYFHREFKKSIKGVGAGFVVHHKNFKKEDNRNCNLQILSEEEHKLLHEQRAQMKVDKSIEKYITRGERMRERYLSYYPKNKRKKAHSTFMRKFKESNPNVSWKTASYKWKKFKEKHNIS